MSYQPTMSPSLGHRGLGNSYSNLSPTQLSRSKRREIVVLGFRGVGKSSVIIQFVENTWVEQYYPTIENTFEKTMNFRGEPIALQILDTTGQDELTIFSPRHMVGIHGYLLVYDVTSRQSFRVVQHIYDKICNTIGTMTTHRYIPIVLVGNKCDLDHDRAVSCEEGRQLAQEWQCAFIEASAKHNENIKAAFHQLLQQVQENEGPAKVLDVGLCEKISAWWWWWWCCCGCCCGCCGGPGESEYEPIQDQNGSMMGSPVAGQGNRFRRYPERRPGRSGSGSGYDGGGHRGHRTKIRTSSAASDYFLGYGGDGDHHDGPEGHCCGHECCVRCCTLTALSQKRLYYWVGVCTLLMMVVGAGSMFTGFQIAIEADNSVPSIPSHRNSSTNHTNHTTTPSSNGGGASLFLLPSSSSSSSSSSSASSSPSASLRSFSASAFSASASSSASSSSASNTISAPVPWKPVNPSNLEGAWFAYGAIGLGLYTVVISVAGLRGVQRLNKDMLRLFSCSALLDFVVHMGAFFVYNTDSSIVFPTGSWISHWNLSNVLLPCLFAVELTAAVSSFVLQFNLYGSDDLDDGTGEDDDHPYLASTFDSGMSHINQSTTYLADDRMGARTTSIGGGRRHHSYHTSYGAAAGGRGNRGYY